MWYLQSDMVIIDTKKKYPRLVLHYGIHSDTQIANILHDIFGPYSTYSNMKTKITKEMYRKNKERYLKRMWVMDEIEQIPIYPITAIPFMRSIREQFIKYLKLNNLTYGDVKLDFINAIVTK